MTKYHPALRPDVVGPPDASRGYSTLTAWVEREPLGLAMRYFTTDADIRAAIHARPKIIDLLRQSPGPYAQHVAAYDAERAMREIDLMMLARRRGYKKNA